ncbi:MAG: ABC transporter ATP-binding protein [Candidatus Binataceae bacterium]|jgi:ABC-2 type transport system ATP-binding protein
MISSEKMSVLEAIEISKHYGSRIALDRVSLAVRPGEIVGLLGPNGAGKTTTLSILSTQMRPDSGHILIGGKPAASARTRGAPPLGLVPQSLALYPTLSGAQNVMHFARMQGLSRGDARLGCARALEDVGLTPRADDAMYSYSDGMKRRLNLACGIVHHPAILLLDEPTVGVDPQSREQILTLVRRFADASCAVIYSTHYMEEAERLSDRVLLIDRGKLVADGKVEALIALGGGRPRMELTYRGNLSETWMEQLTDVREIAPSSGGGKLVLEMLNFTQVGEVLQQLRAVDVNVIDFSLHSPNLADAFIALTGRTLRDSVL